MTTATTATAKNAYDVSEDRCHVCGCHFDGQECECQRLTGEENEEDADVIRASVATQYDEETGRFDSFLRWDYDLPVGYKFTQSAPIEADYPVLEIRGLNQHGVNTLVGYAAHPVARVYEGEILPAQPFGALGTLCYSIQRAEVLAEKQLAQMEEGYGD